MSGLHDFGVQVNGTKTISEVVVVVVVVMPVAAAAQWQ